MDSRKRLSIKAATVAGIAASVVLGLAGLALNPAPANAVVYCTYVGYPGDALPGQASCSVARAAVRHNAGGNMNGGVNRVGARR